MPCTHHLAVLVLLILQLAQPTYGILDGDDDGGGGGGDTSTNISRYTGGVLLHKGSLTSCELAPVDNFSAFVAANCLNTTTAKASNANSIVYQVALTLKPKTKPNTAAAAAAAAVEIYNVEAISIYPFFDSQTLANNVALLKFNAKKRTDDGDTDYDFGAALDEWPVLEYIRSTVNISPLNASTSAKQINIRDGKSPNSGCFTSSNLFKDNSNALLCSSLSTPYVRDRSCSVPYGALRGRSDNGSGGDYDSAILALYSHSAVHGKGSLCQQNLQQFSYYTVLSHYSSWAETEIYGGKGTVVIFAMHGDNKTAVNNIAVVGGDLYSQSNPALSQKSGTSTSQKTPSSSSSPSPSDADNDNSSNTSTSTPASASALSRSSSLTTGQKAGIGIGVSLGIILLAILLFFFAKWMKKRKLEAYWDKEVENMRSQKSLSLQLQQLQLQHQQLQQQVDATAAAAPVPSPVYMQNLNFPSSDPSDGPNYVDRERDMSMRVL